MQTATKLMTVNEVAGILNLRPCTIRKMIYQKRLEVVRLGRSVRIRQEVIDQAIKNGLK